LPPALLDENLAMPNAIDYSFYPKNQAPTEESLAYDSQYDLALEESTN